MRHVFAPSTAARAGARAGVPADRLAAVVADLPRASVRREDARMDVEWGPDGGWGSGPRLDEFLLARIAEDKHIATDAAAGGAHRDAGRNDPFDPDRVLAECSAKRGMVLACRAARPDLAFLGSRPPGLRDFPLSPTDQHQLAALTLGLLALPYAGHRDYRPEWRP